MNFFEELLEQCFKATVVAGPVMFVLTPGINWVNARLSAKPLPGWYRRPFAGATLYVTSALPGYTIAFVADKGLTKVSSYSLINAFFAGFLAGFGTSAYECVGLNRLQLQQQLEHEHARLSSATKSNASENNGDFARKNERHAFGNPPSSRPKVSNYQLIRQMCQSNGLSSLGRGGLSVGFREGGWAAAYMVLPKRLGHLFLPLGFNEKYAEASAAVLVGGMFGGLTAPLVQLRNRKQEYLFMQRENKSYWQHAHDIWNKEPHAKPRERIGFFFTAARERTLLCAVGCALMHGAKQTYEHFTLQRR